MLVTAPSETKLLVLAVRRAGASRHASLLSSQLLTRNRRRSRIHIRSRQQHSRGERSLACLRSPSCISPRLHVRTWMLLLEGLTSPSRQFSSYPKCVRDWKKRAAMEPSNSQIAVTILSNVFHYRSSFEFMMSVSPSVPNVSYFTVALKCWQKGGLKHLLLGLGF